MLRNVNRCADALRRYVGVRPEERVLLLLLDGPAFVYSFFGAIKAGAVPIPTNTALTPRDLLYILSDSRAVAAVVSASLLSKVVRNSPSFARRTTIFPPLTQE